MASRDHSMCMVSNGKLTPQGVAALFDVLLQARAAARLRIVRRPFVCAQATPHGPSTPSLTITWTS